MTVIEKLQKLQNRAAKLVTNSQFDATALPVIRALQWPTVRELIDFESQKMVFRSLKGDAPSYMNDMFTRVNNSTARSLRNAEVYLRLPLLKSAGGQKCFSYRGAKLWNSLGTDKIGIKCFSRFLLVAHGRKPSKLHFYEPIRRRISEEDRRNV